MSFTATFDRGQKFRRVVRGWKRGLGNLKWFWPAAFREVGKVHKALFDSQGATGRNGRWTDLAEATKRFRERGVGYYGKHVGMASAEGPVLHWTFRLRDSLDDFHAQGTVNSVRRSFKSKMIWGTKHPAAWELHNGTLGLPARELLDEEGSRTAVVDLMNKTLANQLRTSKGGNFRRMR